MAWKTKGLTALARATGALNLHVTRTQRQRQHYRRRALLLAESPFFAGLTSLDVSGNAHRRNRNRGGNLKSGDGETVYIPCEYQPYWRRRNHVTRQVSTHYANAESGFQIGSAGNAIQCEGRYCTGRVPGDSRSVPHST